MTPKQPRTPQRSTRRENMTDAEEAPNSPMGLLGPAEVRAIAAALGIRPTKVLGQNFVHDAGTVRRIVRAGGVELGDEVVEVGPGLGSLTLALLEAGARVRAVEIDPPLATALPETVRSRMPEAASRFHVVCADALSITSAADLSPQDPEVSAAPWPAPTRLVANLPYNVAVPVLLTLLERLPSLTDVLVMVQAEVADRLAAAPGNRTYGVPSVKAAWYGDVDRVGTIGRSVFWPVPNVDSALVRIRRTSTPRGSEALRQATFEVVDIAFGQRRKTLRAALKTWAGSAVAAERVLGAAGIDTKVRGETLGIEQFVALGQAVLDARAAGLLSTDNALRPAPGSDPATRVSVQTPPPPKTPHTFTAPTPTPTPEP